MPKKRLKVQPAPTINKRRNLQETARVHQRTASMALRILAFVDHYRTSFNATQAAIAAGYAEAGAEAYGSRLLHDPRTQQLLAQHALDAIALTNVRTEDILKAASEIAYLDPGQCFEQLINATNNVVTLRLKDITEMPLEVRRCVSSFKIIKKNLVAGDGFIDTIIEVKFWSKPDALKLLAAYKNLLAQKSEEVMTAKQLEKMSDEELARVHREAAEKWERHAQARARQRLALVAKG